MTMLKFSADASIFNAKAAEGKKEKEKGKNTCRTIEDGIGSAFDSNDVSYPRRC